MLQTYDFQDQVRQLDGAISLIINDAPTLLGLIGMSGESLYATKFEWMSDNLNSNRATVKNAALATDTQITVGDGEGNKFRVNAYVVYGREYLRVTAVAGDVVTFERGFDGTTAVTIAAGEELRIVSRPQVEGAGLGIDEGHDRYTDFNHTQIFERFAEVTGTQMAVRTHNVGNELQYQVNLRMKELAREFNDTLIYGRRRDVGRGTPRTTGGIRYFAEQKNSYRKNLNGAEVSAKDFNDLMEQVYLRGGQVNTILTNTAGARQLSKMAGGTITTERADTVTGHRIQTFVSDIVGGNMATIVVDPNLPKDEIILLDRSIVTMHPLNGRGLWDEDSTVKGVDAVSRQIRGEYGIKIKNANESIAVLENVSKSVV